MLPHKLHLHCHCLACIVIFSAPSPYLASDKYVSARQIVPSVQFSKVFFAPIYFLSQTLLRVGYIEHFCVPYCYYIDPFSTMKQNFRTLLLCCIYYGSFPQDYFSFHLHDSYVHPRFHALCSVSLSAIQIVALRNICIHMIFPY